MKNSLGLPHSIGINYALRGNNSRANVIEISRWTCIVSHRKCPQRSAGQIFNYLGGHDEPGD